MEQSTGNTVEEGGGRSLFFSWNERGSPVAQDFSGEKSEKDEQPMHVPVAVAVGKSHFLHLTELGQVYSWGEPSYGKLGLGHQLEKAVPTLITSLKSKKIVQVACGDHHSLALDENGSIFSWGCGYEGRLGLGNNDSEYVPFLIDSLKRKKIVSIACGNTHSLALSNEGEMFSWGSNSFGKLGVGSNGPVKIPRHITCKFRIVKISGGYSHSCALTEEGQILTWGLGNNGRLGHGDSSNESSPKIVTFFAEKKVTMIACGAQFTVAVTSASEIFTWGSNTEGQLGIGVNEPQRLLPSRVSGIPSAIDELVAGANHVLLLSNGDVWSWGNGLRSPGKIAIKDSHGKPIAISKVAAGGLESIAVTGFLKSILGEEMKAVFLASPMSAPFSDMRIQLDDGSVFTVHKIVLQTRCPALLSVHQSELEGEVPSGKSEVSAETPKIRVVNAHYEAVLHFLTYLYSDTVPLTSVNQQRTEEELLYLSVRYSVSRLESYCRKQGAIQSRLAEDFASALSKPMFSDFAFVHGEARIPVHRYFLASRCKYYQSMFSSNMMEANLTELEVDDMDLETLEALLKYIYADKIDTTPTVAIELLSVANQYQIPRLKFLCEGIIEKGVDVESVAYVYKAAKLYEALNLVDFCTEVILSEWNEVTSDPSWLEHLDEDERSELKGLYAKRPTIVLKSKNQSEKSEVSDEKGIQTPNELQMYAQQQRYTAQQVQSERNRQQAERDEEQRRKKSRKSWYAFWK